MANFTKEEARWLDRLEKLLAAKPGTVKLYTLDGEIVACKVGVSSYELNREIASLGTLGGGCFLADIHDDFPEPGACREGDCFDY